MCQCWGCKPLEKISITAGSLACGVNDRPTRNSQSALPVQQTFRFKQIIRVGGHFSARIHIVSSFEHVAVSGLENFCRGRQRGHHIAGVSN